MMNLRYKRLDILIPSSLLLRSIKKVYIIPYQYITTTIMFTNSLNKLVVFLVVR